MSFDERTLSAVEDGTASSGGEFETPAGYIQSVRQALRDHDMAAKGYLSPKVAAQMYFEEERATARADAYIAERGTSDTPLTEEQAQWLREGFAGNMSRLVNISMRGDAKGYAVTSFIDLPEDQQTMVRERMLEEYLALCRLLAADEPAKVSYSMAPALYMTPEDTEYVLATNSDFSRSVIARFIMHYPSDPQAAIDKARQQAADAFRRYPTLPRGEIRRIVAARPDNPDKALQEYAAKRGWSLDPGSSPHMPPEDLLATVRTLLQSEQYHLSHVNQVPEMVEAAEAMGKDASDFLDEMGEEPRRQEQDSYQIFRRSFQTKIKQLYLVADHAWRTGEVEFSIAASSPDFRRTLYATALAEYALIYAELGGNITKSFAEDHPLLYIDARTVSETVRNNADIAVSYLGRIILRSPADPEIAVRQFRQRVQQAMHDNPRLLESQAKRIALERPLKKIAPEQAPEIEHLSPEELLQTIRTYLQGEARLGTHVAKDIRFEIEERLPEAVEYFTQQGWSFKGEVLGADAQAALTKKIREFIIASERAYRKKNSVTRLRDYTDSQRQELYQVVAEDFVAIGKFLKTGSKRQWNALPVLYTSSGELAELRDEYSWLRESRFRDMALTQHNGLRAALKRAVDLKADLQRRYPGISPALAEHLAFNSPLSADTGVMEHIRRTTQRDAKRFDSRTRTPDTRRPAEYLRHLQTQFRHKRVSNPSRLSDEKEAQLDAVIEDTLDHLLDQHGGLPEETIDRFVRQIQRFARGSEAMADKRQYPRFLDLPSAAQAKFIALLYENHQRLSQAISSINGDPTGKLRVLEFGFFNSSQYLGFLQRQYEPYLAPNLIVYAALNAPFDSWRILNLLVEKSAFLLKANPSITPEKLHEELGASAQKLVKARRSMP